MNSGGSDMRIRYMFEVVIRRAGCERGRRGEVYIARKPDLLLVVSKPERGSRSRTLVSVKFDEFSYNHALLSCNRTTEVCAQFFGLIRELDQTSRSISMCSNPQVKSRSSSFCA